MTWSSIALGLRHSCGITPMRELYCWGDNGRGQVGDGTQTLRTEPTRVGEHADWASVAAGGNETCARKLDDTLWCWGQNSSGQIGDGTAWSAGFVAIAP